MGYAKNQKETKMSEHLRILATADWHLRADKPPCRTDDFFTVQEKTLDMLAETAEEYCVDFIAVAGDIFHRSTVPDWLKYMVASKFYHSRVEGVIGNHDVGFNKSDFLPKSSLGVLDSAGIINCTSFYEFFIRRLHCDNKWKDIQDDDDIVIAHQYVYKNKPPFPGAEGTGREVRKLPKTPRLIISGDNHQSFTLKTNKRLVVNPGAITRQRSDMDNHTPKAYIIDVSLDEPEVVPSFESIELPDTEDVITREHIEHEEEREKRFATLTDRLNETEATSISFKENLEHKMEHTQMRKNVKQEISNKLAKHTGEQK